MREGSVVGDGGVFGDIGYLGQLLVHRPGPQNVEAGLLVKWYDSDSFHVFSTLWMKCSKKQRNVNDSLSLN